MIFYAFSVSCIALSIQFLKVQYKIEEWISRYSDGFVPIPRHAAVFNDDRLARDLSALYRADRQSLMTELSIKAIKAHEIMTDEIHNDSTSITLMGAYETNDPNAAEPNTGITRTTVRIASKSCLA